MQNKRSTVSLLIDPTLQETLDDAAFQLRQTQTQVATAALRFYLSHLQKTHQVKPTTEKPLPVLYS